jgi:M6 family metalloprotease-like protein
MLCGWPDTYDYDKDYPTNVEKRSSCGAGAYDLMSGAGSRGNPALPNPFYRIVLSGWGSLKRLNNYASPTQLFASANSSDVFIYETGRSKEYFMIENYRRTGRRSDGPGNGLLIWHIDETGDNRYEQMTSDKHYMVSVEQADGAYHLEKK